VLEGLLKLVLFEADRFDRFDEGLLLFTTPEEIPEMLLLLVAVLPYQKFSKI